MKIIAGLLILTSVSAAPSFVNKPGITLGKINMRIVGGEDAKPFKYPFILSLQKNRVHKCGGTLVHGNMVITAGHCAPKPGDITTWKAVSHRYDLSVPLKEEEAIEHKVLSAVAHPKFSRDKPIYDISVWKIEGTFSHKVGLYYDNGFWAEREDSLLKVAGWGLTKDEKQGGQLSDKLQEIDIPVVNFDQCNAAYSKEYGGLDRTTQFCAGVKTGLKDACDADSGGPIFTVRDNKTVLVGIVSYGIICGDKEHPGVYTRIANLQKFIGMEIEKANPQFKKGKSIQSIP